MKISAATSYALQALIRLAEGDQSAPIPACRLASSDIPTRFLSQLLLKLVGHHVLTSTPGAAGGYHLARPPEAITFLEIIEAIDGPFSISISRGSGLATDARNELNSKFADTSKYVRERFERMTLAELAASGPNKTLIPTKNTSAWCAAKDHGRMPTIQLDCLQQTVGSTP